MKPAPFEYAVPKTVAEAVALLKQHDGEAKVLAGGQSLIPLLNMRLARPALLVDVARIPELDYIREAGGALAIGAMVRQRVIEESDLVRRRQPLLHGATSFIAHPQIRNRGTIGGSLAHADPAAVYPAVAVALGAELRVAGPGGERTIPASEFFVSYLTTSLDAAEVLTEVRLPALPARTGWAFKEVSRRHGDFALAGVAVLMTLDGGGVCTQARIVPFGVGPVPVRAAAAERVLIGQRPGEKVFEQAAAQVAAAIEAPLSDIHASGEYRKSLAAVLTRRALAEAAVSAASAA